MADQETIHKIVEKFELQGDQKVAAAFDALAKKANDAAKALDMSAKGVHHAGEELDGLEDLKLNEVMDDLEGDLDEVGEKGKKAGGSIFSSFEDVAKVAIGNFMADALMRAGEMLVNMAHQAFQINVAFEAMQSRVQGMVMAFQDLGTDDPMKMVAKSARVANATLESFQDIAVKTATAPQAIESGFSTVLPVLTEMGQSQQDVLDMTEMIASAAKVTGDDFATAAQQITKGLALGTVEGEKGIALLLRQKAKLTSDMSEEERLQRVQKVLKQLAGPMETVTQDTESMMTRFRILTYDILQRATYPLFQLIGKAFAYFNDLIQDNEDYIDSMISGFQDTFFAVYQLVGGAVDLVMTLFKATGATEQLMNRFEFLTTLFQGAVKIVKLMGQGFSFLAEMVKVIIDPQRGVGKLLLISDQIKHTFSEIFLKFMQLMESFVKFFKVPETLQDYVPGMKKLEQFRKGIAEGLETSNKAYEKDLEKRAETLAEREKRLGMSVSTQAGREAEARKQGFGLSAKEREEMLSGIFGKGADKKPLVNVERVEIKQDFSDVDPDRILVEFVDQFERLGEAAVQSGVSGGTTSFGPGATI